jgi:hypothetical protein
LDHLVYFLFGLSVFIVAFSIFQLYCYFKASCWRKSSSDIITKPEEPCPRICFLTPLHLRWTSGSRWWYKTCSTTTLTTIRSPWSRVVSKNILYYTRMIVMHSIITNNRYKGSNTGKKARRKILRHPRERFPSLETKRNISRGCLRFFRLALLPVFYSFSH